MTIPQSTPRYATPPSYKNFVKNGRTWTNSWSYLPIRDQNHLHSAFVLLGSGAVLDITQNIGGDNACMNVGLGSLLLLLDIGDVS